MKTLKLYQDEKGTLHICNNDKKEYELIEIEYDETAPCKICGLPVDNASMSGTDICPSCDCGCFRNGEKWTVYPDKYHLTRFRIIAKEKSNPIRWLNHPGYAGDLPGEGGGDGGYYEG
jgi:hypothetical protein